MYRKRNILVREMMQLIDRAAGIQDRISAAYAEAYEALKKANIMLGSVGGYAAGVRIGSGIYGTDLHGGWCDVRILGNGQDAQCDQSCYDDEQRQYGSKDRTVYEEF